MATGIGAVELIVPGSPEDPRLVNHWVDQPEWHGGRRLWSFYLTFAEVDAVAEYAAAYQRQLRGLSGLDLVARRWLHLTVLGAAFVDEVDESAVRGLAAAAIRIAEEEPPLDVTVGPPRPVVDAVWMPVDTSRPLEGLRARLSSAVVHSLGREPYALPLPPEGFRPHLTIGYATAEGPTYGQVEACISRATPPPVTARVSALSLVRLRREPNRWSWDDERRFALRGPE